MRYLAISFLQGKATKFQYIGRNSKIFGMYTTGVRAINSNKKKENKIQENTVLDKKLTISYCHNSQRMGAFIWLFRFCCFFPQQIQSGKISQTANTNQKSTLYYMSCLFTRWRCNKVYASSNQRALKYSVPVQKLQQNTSP